MRKTPLYIAIFLLCSCNEQTSINQVKQSEEDDNSETQKVVVEVDSTEVSDDCMKYEIKLNSILNRRNTEVTSGVVVHSKWKEFDFDQQKQNLGCYNICYINNSHKPHIYSHVFVSFPKGKKWHESDTAQIIQGINIYDPELVLWDMFSVGQTEQELIETLKDLNKFHYKKGTFWITELGVYQCMFETNNDTIKRIELKRKHEC